MYITERLICQGLEGGLRYFFFCEGNVCVCMTVDVVMTDVLKNHGTVEFTEA